jgi:hypothetical protein
MAGEPASLGGLATVKVGPIISDMDGGEANARPCCRFIFTDAAVNVDGPGARRRPRVHLRPLSAFIADVA